jgi:hypothetical protein
VLRTLLSQVNQREDPPGTLDEASVAWGAATLPGGTVVILDDAGSEAQVRPVLSTNVGLKVIVTSRLALPGIDVRERIGLGPLPAPKARLCWPA